MNDDYGYVNVDYLHALAQLMKPVKTSAYGMLEVTDESRVLDVGCGPGIDLLELGKNCFNGEVLGVDFDPEMVKKANAAILAACLQDRCKALEGDAASLPFDAGMFDCTRGERVMVHVPDELAVMKELMRVTKPGGWIVLTEPDTRTLTVSTDNREFEERLHWAIASELKHPFIGSDLYGLMVRAGLEDVRYEIFPLSTTNFDVLDCFMRYREWRGYLVKKGTVGAGEFDQWIKEQEKLSARGEFFSGINYYVVAGRRG